MKISKWASVLFAVLGAVLLVGTIAASFVALGRPDPGLKPSEEARRCAGEALEALGNGDFSAVESYLYGKPDLGLDREPGTQAGKELWKAYKESVTVLQAGTCFSEGTAIFQTAEVTALDLSSALSGLDKRASVILQNRLETAVQAGELTEEETPIPQTWKEEALSQALTESIAQAKNKTYQVTIQLIQKDDQWWVLPDQAMLDLLSGGLR